MTRGKFATIFNKPRKSDSWQLQTTIKTWKTLHIYNKIKLIGKNMINILEIFYQYLKT